MIQYDLSIFPCFCLHIKLVSRQMGENNVYFSLPLVNKVYLLLSFRVGKWLGLRIMNVNIISSTQL